MSGRPVTPELAELLRDVGVDADAARMTWARSGRGARSDYLVLPSPARPQVLVPWVSAAAPLVAERRSRQPIAAVARHAVATALSTGIATRLPWPLLRVGDTALDELTLWATGSDAYRVGVLIGPPRANRKPVLRVFDDCGKVWGFAKMGINPLTSGLVDHEVAALERLASLEVAGIRVPRVIRSGDWRGRTVLVTSPLALSADKRQPSLLPVDPTRALFMTHAEYDVPLSGAAAIATAVQPASQEAERIEALAVRLLKAIGDMRIPLGSAHGDWTPWNMAWSGTTLEVWDWERFATGIPQGQDVIHFEASRVQAEAPEKTEGAFVGGLAQRLSACGVDPALTHHLLALYLVGIGRRYAADKAVQPARRLSLRLDWVLRLLTTEVSRLETQQKG